MYTALVGDPLYFLHTAFGFSEDASLTVGNNTFAIAHDTCNGVWDMNTRRHFDIPVEDMEYILFCSKNILYLAGKTRRSGR